MRYYISIEKAGEGFELFKTLWQERGVCGIRADTMTECIEKAIEIEKSKADELYFIDIVAADINYMPQLQILSEQTTAPILIAASEFDGNEREEALNNGADFYGEYLETPEQNINAVLSVINSIDRRARKQKPLTALIGGDIILFPSYRKVLVKDTEINLVNKEFELLRVLMANKGRFLSNTQLLRKVWGEEYNENGSTILWKTISCLRSKIAEVSPEKEYIKVKREVGYIFLA